VLVAVLEEKVVLAVQEVQKAAVLYLLVEAAEEVQEVQKAAVLYLLVEAAEEVQEVQKAAVEVPGVEESASQEDLAASQEVPKLEVPAAYKHKKTTTDTTDL
jgi:hypothetical protein